MRLPLIFLLLLCAAVARAVDEPAPAKRQWQGIPGLERTAKGRVFVSWFSGGPKEPSPENEVYLCHSDDDGKTFAPPLVMAQPKDGSRCFDPTLWIDPKGRLWYIFNRGNKNTAVHDVHARICDDPEATPPVFGPEFRAGYDQPYAFRMNKPTVLSTGEWIMPVTHAAESIHDWFAGPKQLQGVGISTDEGRSWKLHGALKAPSWALECMITELRDGRLWLLTRTGGGFLWESHSADKGRTWSETTASAIANPGSRFFIRRLASGNLLLVNHYKFKGRSHLTARLSTDDGATWNDGLLLDERSNVSYPDGVQDKSGLIWITYDHDRQGAGEILLAKFREEDVTAGKDVSGAVTLKQTVNKLDKATLLPAAWDPALAGDEVMARLVNTSSPRVKGAHDAEFVCVGERAFVVAEANDVRAGENAGWPFIYVTLSVVNIKTLAVEKVIDFARSEQVFENETLPAGACFVPRIIQKDVKTLRCYFTSEEPGKRQSQMWRIDFDIERMAFENRIHKTQIKTAAGTFDMQPQYFHADAAAQGFKRPAKDAGLFIFDSFKQFDGRTYVALNNFPAGQNALALVHDDLATFEVVGHYNEPQSAQLSESAVNRLPDGAWMAICRSDKGNYHFATSADGKTWSEGKEMPFVPNGVNSKPTFDKFGGVYYLGWQEATQIQGVRRSVFNIDISLDGKTWERKYRFETPQSFQYPTLHDHDGCIWLAVTQGASKERIMFGKLEDVGQFESQAGKTRKPLPPPQDNAANSGEALYNGLVLPEVWPPREPVMKAGEPMPVPWLAHPPAVIPIDVGRQLFVDDFLIESTSMQREHHAAVVYEGNPVLKPETPAELSGKAPMAMPFSDGVWFDPADRLFKMWYMAGYGKQTAYATSRDGLHWEKPALDVVPGTNVVQTDARDSSTVWLDLEESDPQRRYKMWRSHSEDKRFGLSLHFSADGIHWSPRALRTGSIGDRSTVFWNPFRKVWVYSLRHGWGAPRARRYWEVKDLLAGPLWTQITEPVMWIGSDRLDPPREDIQEVPQLYNLDAVAYESLMVGLFTIWRGDKNLPPGRPKPNSIWLGYSRDGYHWDRPDRHAFIPVSENKGGWNWGNVQSAGGCFLVVGDKLWFYFSGRAGVSPEMRDGNGATGLAFLRRDGFASMNAKDAGVLTTRPVKFSGGHLFVNAAAPQGELRVEVLRENGEVVAPFTKENCVAVSGDKTRTEVTWKDATDLSKLAGQPVKLRFHLKNGALYSFWVSPDAQGASHGYVAAGGPDFAGPKDR